MASQTHPSIKDGWFREINPQWPGQAMTIKVKQILHQEKSKYQDVLVFDSETYGHVLILDGVIQATERDEFSYQEMIAHLPLASHPNPRHVLVIGGGDGGVVREVLKHASVEHVTLCDIDEAVVRVSKQYLPHMSAVFADPKVTVHIGDGFKFLPEHEDEYDVIITDSSDPVGPAAALFEAPYFSLLKKALKEGGNMSTQGECLWLHLPLIRELRETTKRLFPVAEYAYTTIPTYPSGQIGFVCCSKDSSRSVSTPLREVPGCKYYNSAIHRAAFVLPEFGRAMIEDSQMILTDYAAGVRPGHKAEGKTSGKKVLLLGSGFVAAPCAEYVTKKGHQLTVACRTLATAEALCNGLDNASPATVDVNDPSALDAAIAEHDLVISLIPYTYHAAVIKSAIKHKKHVVTTSYVSPAMRELDAEAKAAGIVVMNEIGLDPGIDHLWAIKALTEVKKEGGKVRSFISMCGGLPSAQAADNALGYKLSWSARGVLLALRNNAKFLQDGRVVEVLGKDLMASAKPFHVKSAFNFVCYPNRDSVPFVEYYDLKDAHTCIRGTLRFAGFPEVVLGLVEMNFLDDNPRDYLKEGTTATWVETTAEHLGAEPTEAGIIFKLKQLDAFKKDGPLIISKLRSLGLFSDRQITPRGNMLDTLCALLEKELAFGPDEVDLVMLQHKFEIENADGSFKTLTSTLEAYGEVGGHSAMAKTVGVPCGVAVDCILDGRISGAGVRAPYDEATCSLLRDELEKEGITMVEKIV